MRFLRIADVAEKLSVSTVTIWRWEQAGILPPKRRLGPNAVGWTEAEIDEFLRERPAVRQSNNPPDEIRA